MKKKCISLLCLAFISFFAVAQTSTVTEFAGEELNGVIASGAIDINIKAGSSTGVEVKLYDDDSSKLTLELTEEGYVRVGYGSNSTNLFVGKNKRPKATITLPRLDYVNLSGGAMLLSSGKFECDEFVISLRGNSFSSFINMTCGSAAVTTEDNAKIEELTLESKGEVTLKSYGSSNMSIKGTAPSVEIITSSMSEVNILNFRSDKIEAITSGASLIKAYVSVEANVTSSGISSFKYTGEGKVTGKAKEL